MIKQLNSNNIRGIMIKPLELARQMAVFSYIDGTKNVGSIAQLSGLSGLIVTNAVFAGEKAGLFTVKRDKHKTIEKIEVSDEQFAEIVVTRGNFGEAVDNLLDEIVTFVNDRNSVERDAELYSLQLLARAPELMFFVAVEIFKTLEGYTTYDFADPKDKKSVYTFLTRTENVDKKWYAHKFKKLK